MKIVVLDPESSDPTWGDLAEAWQFEVPDGWQNDAVWAFIDMHKQERDWENLDIECKLCHHGFAVHVGEDHSCLAKIGANGKATLDGMYWCDCLEYMT